MNIMIWCQQVRKVFLFCNDSKFIGWRSLFYFIFYFLLQTVQPDFGARPMQASTEQEDILKIRTQADPPMRLFENHEDHFIVTLYKVMRDLLEKRQQILRDQWRQQIQKNR